MTFSQNQRRNQRKEKKRITKCSEENREQQEIKDKTDTHNKRTKDTSRRNLFTEHKSVNEQKNRISGTVNTESSPRKRKRQLPGQNILEKVKQRSRQEANAWKTIEQYHEKRLDILLACNGFERLKVPADGDCFFNSAKCQLEETITVETMRERLGNK